MSGLPQTGSRTDSPSSSTPRVPVGDLVGLVSDLFMAVGIPGQAAAEVAEALVRADQEGQPSHGVMMTELYLRRIADGSVSTRIEGEIVSDRGATAVIDAFDALGQLTAGQAIDLACRKAEASGIGIVVVRNAFHFGTASRYTERAASQGMIGLAMCNTRPLMPAPGGAKRVVGNNPIGIAVPMAPDRALSFDMATSQAAMGKIRHAAAAGTSIEPDWATDAAGVPTTDPNEAIAGMLLPVGGPKGFGLALMIDLLSGLLAGGGWGDAVTPLFGDTSVPYNSSQLFIAIDPGFFGSPQGFQDAAQQAAERIRSSPRADATSEASPARAPGDARHEARVRNRDAVPIAAAVLANLVAAAERHDVPTRRLDDYLTPS